MLKINILDMKNFLDTVNSCKGAVHMLSPDGGKKDINGQGMLQARLSEQYRQNKNCLRLTLEIPVPKDYMRIVSYYAGDC